LKKLFAVLVLSLLVVRVFLQVFHNRDGSLFLFFIVCILDVFGYLVGLYLHDINIIFLFIKESAVWQVRVSWIGLQKQRVGFTEISTELSR
jgi:hypothetical protein